MNEETTQAPNNAKLTLIGLVILLVVGALVVRFLFFLFSHPDRPYAPRFYYDNYESVIVTPVRLVVQKDYNNSSLLKYGKEEDHQYAVFRFDSPEGTQAGALISDTISLLLRHKGVSVVERDNIDKILLEQNISSKKDEAEAVKKLGKLLSVHYMIVGAVTFYDASGSMIHLPMKIREEDREEYEAEYRKYKDWYIHQWWNIWTSPKEFEKKLRVDDQVLSLEDLEEEYKKYSKQEYRVVATVGVSMKVVRVRDGKIVWAGQAETNDTSLVNASSRIVETFLKNM